MNRIRSILALVLTLCLLTAGAMLPVIVEGIQNKRAAVPGFSAVQSVDLKLEEPLTIPQKLSVLAAGQYYPTSQNTVLTKDQLLERVESGLGPFYDRELVPYNWKDISIGTNSYIAYREDAPERNYTVWFVALENQDWQGEMIVDDETGTILAIQFTSYTEQAVYITSGHVRQVKEAWFESVGFSEDDWKEKDLGISGSIRTLRCYSSGAVQAGLVLEFITSPNGFMVFAAET